VLQKKTKPPIKEVIKEWLFPHALSHVDTALWNKELLFVKVLLNDVFIQSCKSLRYLTLSHVHVTNEKLVSFFKLHGPTLFALLL
jgi:hypothetical protein